MKAARIILISLGVLGLLLVIVAALALNSSVQTWAARRTLAAQPDLNATLGSVSVGLQRVEVRGFRGESKGAVLTLPTLDAELPVVAAGLRHHVEIRRVVAKGWTLDLTRAANLKAAIASLASPAKLDAKSSAHREFSLLSSAIAADTPAVAVESVFRGVFAGLELPVDLSLDGAQLEGEIILPDVDGSGVGRLQVKLVGGGLAAGKEGVFDLTAAGTKPDGGALTFQGKLMAEMDTPRTFTRFATKADASASGTQFPEGVALKIDGSALRSAGGETYALLLAGNEKQLADIKAELTSATAQITGTWKLDLRDRDVAPFMMGKTLPIFTATGQGGFETDTAFKEVHASGNLDASADRLESVRPELAAVGAMKLTADFDVLQHTDSLRVERFNANLATGPESIARIHALQPFEFNLATGELRVADPAQELVGLSLTGLPVAWLRPFTGDLEASGGNVRGEFVASARDGGLALRSKSPLTANDISLKQAGNPMLEHVDLLLAASADYTPRGWQLQVVELTARSKDKVLLSLTAKAGKLNEAKESLKATGRWTAELPGWSSQPITGGNLQLSAGSAQGDFSASLGTTKAIEANIALSKLVTLSGEALPLVNADVRADVTAESRTTFNATLGFEQESRKSDLLLTGTLTPEVKTTVVDARISSDRVVLEDVKLLAALFSGGAEEEEAPSPRDEVPFWGEVKGQATLALKKVVYGGAYEISDVVGVLRIGPEGLKLEGVQAVFGPESDLKLSGAVTFDPKLKESYVFTGDMALTNFDTAQAFRAIDPAKLPTIETRMNLTGKISGTGENLATLTERAQGRFDVTSKGGVFRALTTVLPEGKLQATQTALSVVGGLFGGGGSGGEMVETANEIVKLVSEIQFDQLSVSAERDDNLNLVLKDFTLIAPYIRLGGEGLIHYTPGQSLLQQALDLRITLGARGRLGELLSQWKLLKAEKDNLGYTAFVAPIKIGGTVGNTDARDFQAKLLSVALEKSGVGDALNRLLGGGKQ